MGFPVHLSTSYYLTILQDNSTVQNCSGLLPPSSCYLVDSVKNVWLESIEVKLDRGKESTI